MIQESNRGTEKKAGTNSECPFYRGDRFIKESVERESTVCLFASHYLLETDFVSWFLENLKFRYYSISKRLIHEMWG